MKTINKYLHKWFIEDSTLGILKLNPTFNEIKFNEKVWWKQTLYFSLFSVNRFIFDLMHSSIVSLIIAIIFTLSTFIGTPSEDVIEFLNSFRLEYFSFITIDWLLYLILETIMWVIIFTFITVTFRITINLISFLYFGIKSLIDNNNNNNSE
tara:strand:- start:9265 stop:9720 length:456 start_codon:yes stop_codon:yes gene_type:complete